MTLYEQWNALAQQERTQQQSNAFWDMYFQAEAQNYAAILKAPDETVHGTVTELAEKFGMEPVFLMAFLDGINTSLRTELKLEEIEPESEVSLDIDFEKLFYNMNKAKAPWLYNLKDWDGVLSEEKRREITKTFRQENVFVSETKVGRNDPCPCGSGKKYKKCCGR